MPGPHSGHKLLDSTPSSRHRAASTSAAGGRLKWLLGAQRSQYLGTAGEYLCLTLARVASATAPAMSVTVGLRCDDRLRQQLAFLADPALPLQVVNKTCERCPLADCEVRAAPPTQMQQAAERASFEVAVAALVRGRHRLPGWFLE